MHKTYRKPDYRSGLMLMAAVLAWGIAAQAHATHSAHADDANDQRNVITSSDEREHPSHALPASLLPLVAAHQSVAGAYAGAVLDEALCRADASLPRTVNVN